MSDGMLGPMLGGESACVKAGRAPARMAAAPMRQIRWIRRRRMSPPWVTHARNCRLSECNPPGVLECRPGPEGIAPVDSVVQQEALQEQHVSRLPFSVSTNAKAGAMVPIFSESAGSVEKICGRGPVDRYRAAPAGAWSIRPAGSTQLNPGQSPDRPGLTERVRLKTANTGQKLKPAQYP